MNKVAMKIFVVMFAMALFVTAFSLSTSQNFFVVAGDALGVVTVVTDKVVGVVDWLTEADSFSPDDKIIVERHYFDDGHYADLAYKFTIKGSFAKRVFLYCSNPNVRRMETNRTFIPIMDEGLWKWRFKDAGGNVLYNAGSIWNMRQLRGVTYYEYLTDYQKNPSKYGWNW